MPSIFNSVRLKNMAYQYPDEADGITLSLVLSSNLALEKLDDAERTVFSTCKDLFHQKSYETLLDLGCGKGRLILKFADFFKRITALDPDERRLGKAKEMLRKNNINHVDYISKTFEDAEFPENVFDVVLCNQIIQHVPTDFIEPMMQGIFKVLRKNGLLILATSHSRRKCDYFFKSYLKKGNVKTSEITEREFNGLTTNTQQILPIHYFSERSLDRHLSIFKKISHQIYEDVYPHALLDTVLFVGQKAPV